MNLAKQKLSEDRPLLVCSVGIAHPTVIDALGYAGFDCVELDREHGAIGVEAMEWLLSNCRAAGMEPFWRMGKFDEAEMKCALDMGYSSFIIPHSRSAADVERAVAATRYAPRGRRGVGAGRPIRFGLDDPVPYIQRAHEDLMVGFMIEEPEAVEDIEKIVSIEGVGMVQLGFWDLSVAYGLPIQERHPRLVSAATKVLEAARRRGVAVGIPPVSAEDMQHWQQRGARYFEVSSAAGLLSRAAQNCVREYSRLGVPAAVKG
jgi:2-keto-3-deoxy-L-rhamnonate aldolase RhmA